MALYLVKRVGIFYFRRVLPYDVREHFPTNEIWKSLHTHNKQAARRAVRSHATALDVVMERVRSGALTDQEIKIVVSQYMKNWLGNTENGYAQGTKDTSNKQEAIGYLIGEIAYAKQKLANGGRRKYATELSVYEMLKVFEYDMPTDDTTLNKLCWEFEKASLEHLKLQLQLERGEYTGYGADPLRPQLPDVNQPGLLLSEAIEQFFVEREKNEPLEGDTFTEYRAACRLFLGIIGDKRMADIKRSDIQSFRDALPKIPSYINTKREFKNLTVLEAITIAEKQSLQTISMASREKKFSTMKSFMVWASSGGVRIIPFNVADGIKLIKPKVSEQAVEKRKALSEQDIDNLIKGLVVERDNGSFLTNPERYWIPLIALLSGLRLEEISQLLVTDIKEVDGIWCFNADWYDDTGKIVKKLKSGNAKRIVPIHSILISLGFIDFYRQTINASHPRMWMVLTRARNSQKLQRKFKDWYNGTKDTRTGFRKIYVSKDSKKTFHSTRHTVVNFYKQRKLDSCDVAELLGQKHPDLTYDVYGDPVRVLTKQGTMELLKYDVNFVGTLGHWYDFNNINADWIPPTA